MSPQVVVGAAVVRSGRLLAARRTSPPAAAGRWEFPGGKVDPGETPEAALVRELEEELGVTATFVHWLDGEEPVGAYVLRVGLVTLPADATPAPTEHDQLRWLARHQLDDVDWLEGDRPFLVEVAGLLVGLDD